MWLLSWCFHSQPKYDLYYTTLTEVISSGPSNRVPVEEQLAAPGDRGNVSILIPRNVYFPVMKDPVLAQTNSVNSYTLITAEHFFNSASPIYAQIRDKYFERISHFCVRDTGPFSHPYWLHCCHEILHFITFSMLHFFFGFYRHPHSCYYFTIRNNISVQQRAI